MLDVQCIIYAEQCSTMHHLQSVDVVYTVGFLKHLADLADMFVLKMISAQHERIYSNIGYHLWPVYSPCTV